MRRKRAEITWGEPNRRTAGLRGLTARPKKSSVTALGSHGRDNRQDMEMIMRPKNPQYFNDFQYFSIIFNIGVLWFLSYLFPPPSRSLLSSGPPGGGKWRKNDEASRQTEGPRGMRYDRSLVPSSPSHLILFPSLPTVAPLREWHESEDAKHRNEHGSDESGGTRVTHCHFGSVSTGLSPVTLRYLLIIPVGDPVSPRPSFSPAGETGSAGKG